MIALTWSVHGGCHEVAAWCGSTAWVVGVAWVVPNLALMAHMLLIIHATIATVRLLVPVG